MSYATTTIGAALDQINRSYFLPAIQRPFVWKQAQVLALFDSLLKGYPISGFLFWKLEDATKREVRSYRFIENYSGENTMNEPANTDGREVVLVLDGQQRMTSLLIGLRGTYSVKKKHTHKANPDNWERQSLYLDLLKDPDVSGAGDEEEDSNDSGVTYGLKFFTHPPRNSHRNHWIKFGMILDHATPEKLEDLVARVERDLHHGTTEYERRIATTTLRRLHAIIWGEELINFYTEGNQSPDRVLDIFVRANDAGTPLKKADLLMSMITSKWEQGSAREEIGHFRLRIERDLALPNSVTIDFLMKACLTLCDADVKFSVSNFTIDIIRTIERDWTAIRTAIETTFRLINSFGISSSNLSSLNAVLPIAYYLFRTPGFTFRGSSEFEHLNASAMHRWLVQSLLVGAFAGQSDRTIGNARATIREHLKSERGFPIEPLFRALAGGGRISRLDDRAIEEVLAFTYGAAKTFLALSLLYDNLDWSGTTYQEDHIIPQTAADLRVLRGMNLPEHRIQQIRDAVNRLGNLQLLPAGENLEKSDLSFDHWITSRDRMYRARHFIPEDAATWRVTMLPEFVAAREKLIWAELQRLQAASAVTRLA